MTDPLGRSQVIPYLEGLSRKNCEIHIISFEKKLAFLKNKSTVKEILDNSNIIWHPIPYTTKPPIISTLFDIKKMISKSVELHKKHNFDIVHARSYISALAALKLKKKFNLKFIFDMRGFWADERVDGNIWNIKNFIFKSIYNFFKSKEIQFFQNADYIISLTNKAIPEIEKIAKTEKLNIKVIPCCVDLEHFNFSNTKEEIVAKTKIELNINSNDYVLSYLGSIGTWYLLDEMLDFFIELKKTKKTSKFLFITKENEENIKKLAKQKNISRKDIIVKSAERNQVPTFLSISDLNIFFIKPCFSKQASSPTKLGEVLGMGIPVITNSDIGDINKQAANSDFIVLTQNFEREEYGAAIELICKQEFGKEREEIRNKAFELFDINKGIADYYEVYKNLSNNVNLTNK